MLGLKDHSKVSRLSDHNRRTIGSTAPRKVKHPNSKKEGDDEEELMPYYVGRYKVSVTTGTPQQGVQGSSQQDVQELMHEEWQDPIEKGTSDDRIQVETSFVVKKE
jgi:hypothetical protein